MLKSGRYSLQDPEISFHLTVRSNSRRIIAQWRNGELNISIPAAVTSEYLLRYLRDNRLKLLALTPSDKILHIGSRLVAREVVIDIVRSKFVKPGYVEISRNPNGVEGYEHAWSILVSDDVADKIEQGNVQKLLSNMARRCLMQPARQILIPLARECANQVGVAPEVWIIKDSLRNLGTCTQKRTIYLSPRLLFLPDELRRYVIFHELAHLTEMNHSAAFHKLCNNYCDDNEAQLVARLKEFRFPV